MIVTKSLRELEVNKITTHADVKAMNKTLVQLKACTDLHMPCSKCKGNFHRVCDFVDNRGGVGGVEKLFKTCPRAGESDARNNPKPPAPPAPPSPRTCPRSSTSSSTSRSALRGCGPLKEARVGRELCMACHNA